MDDDAHRMRLFLEEPFKPCGDNPNLFYKLYIGPADTLETALRKLRANTKPSEAIETALLAMNNNALLGLPSVPRTTGRIFEFLDILLPKRLRDEELSDASEVIYCLVATGAPSWTITLKTLTTLFWCLLNGYREIVSAFLGRSKTKS